MLHMSVPCCARITGFVSSAVEQSGKEISVSSNIVGIQGEVQKK
jgi:hypothetical protein